MMNKIAIKVQNLTKIYKLYDKPTDRLKEALHPLNKKYHKDFYALNNVNFEIKKGDTVGIIGKNGAGKSTLLKIITGVLTPTSGQVEVNGKISSLLELGAGFNPEYTGIENIYLQGSIMGYAREEMDKKLQDILDFADIGDFVKQPVKSYSSGMFSRLAFAIAINVEPDILIVDEALSVGDMRFQQKCFRKFKEFQDLKKTILFVSHDVGTIVNYCTKAIWIHAGEKQEEGIPNDICKKYTSFMAYNKISISQKEILKNQSTDSINWLSTANMESFGDEKATITHVALLDQDEMKKNIFSYDDNLILKMKLHVNFLISNPIVGFTAYDEIGNKIFGANSTIYETFIPELKENRDYILTFEFTMPMLQNGTYSISPAIAEGTIDSHIQHHWIHNALEFKMNTQNEKAKMGWVLSLDKVKIKVED